MSRSIPSIAIFQPDNIIENNTVTWTFQANADTFNTHKYDIFAPANLQGSKRFILVTNSVNSLMATEKSWHHLTFFFILHLHVLSPYPCSGTSHQGC
jgi:hypothetical protein